MQRLLVYQRIGVLESKNQRAIVFFYNSGGTINYLKCGWFDPIWSEQYPRPDSALEGMCITVSEKEFAGIERRCQVYPNYIELHRPNFNSIPANSFSQSCK